jgi:hypothetical protein
MAHAVPQGARQILLHQSRDRAALLIDFYQNAAAANINLPAIYPEMNGFAINPDEWFCHFFGYKKARDIWDLDWLSRWEAESDGYLVLHGLEPVQKVYAKYFRDEEHPLAFEPAEEIATRLVTAHFMQLVSAAHKKAKRPCAGLRVLPVLATAHDWDTVHQDTVKKTLVRNRHSDRDLTAALRGTGASDSVLAEVQTGGGFAAEWVFHELAVTHWAQIEPHLLARRQQFRRLRIAVLDLVQELSHLLDMIRVQIVVG